MSVYRAAQIQQRKRSIQRRANLGVRPNRRTTKPPVKGLNTRDDIADIRSDEAWELVNWVPGVRGLKLRDGRKFVSAVTDGRQVFTYSSGDSDTVITVEPTTLTALTVSGNVTRTVQSDDWSVSMMNGVLAMVNGSDIPVKFNGTTFSDLTVTPMAPDSLWGIKIHGERSYFWRKGELGFWYSAVEALGGSLTYFPLEQVAQSGGGVMSINSWTRDSGKGSDDLLVITTTKGEVLVYEGTDPTGASGDFGIVGIYSIDEPISKHCFAEFDGKVHLMTPSDFITLPDRFEKFVTPTSRISGALSAEYLKKKTYPQWRLSIAPNRQWVILNIPVNAATSQQFVRALGGWTTFNGWNAVDFTVANGELYMLTKDALFKIGGDRDESVTGETDPLVDDAVNISHSANLAYQFLGTNDEKQIKHYRPLFRSAGTQTITCRISFDASGNYHDAQSLTMESIGASDWGDDWGSDWSNSDYAKAEWFGGSGTGQSVSIRVEGKTVMPMTWVQVGYEFTRGGMY